MHLIFFRNDQCKVVKVFIEHNGTAMVQIASFMGLVLL